MKNITIKAPEWVETTPQEWNAKYNVAGDVNVRLIAVESRSSIDVVVAKAAAGGFDDQYYISSPNFGVAIPSIPTLEETFWITEKLVAAGMPGPDAVTTAQVLRDMGDF